MSNPYRPPGIAARGLAKAADARRLPVYSLVCSVLAALICSLVIPALRGELIRYGMTPGAGPPLELSLLTQMVLMLPHALWMLPLSVLAAWRLLPGPTLGLRVAGVLGIGGMLVLVPLFVIGAYLPIFRLAGAVG